MTMTLDKATSFLRMLQNGQIDRRPICEWIGLREACGVILAHLTQPVQACEHDWAVGYGVPAYCNHCGVERDPRPAQSVDVAKVREVIAYLKKGHRFDAEMADKLTAALPESKP